MTDAMYKEIQERRRMLGLDPDDFLIDIPMVHRIVQIEERYGSSYMPLFTATLVKLASILHFYI